MALTEWELEFAKALGLDAVEYESLKGVRDQIDFDRHTQRMALRRKVHQEADHELAVAAAKKRPRKGAS